MLEMLTNFVNVNDVNLNKEERLASLAGGGILLLYAIIRVPLTAVLAAIAASYLFFRGMRGFCYINDRLGLNRAIDQPVFPEMQNNHKQKTAVPTQ